jgi:hypothetical protein
MVDLHIRPLTSRALSQRSASSTLIPSSAMSFNRPTAAAVGRVNRVNGWGRLL